MYIWAPKIEVGYYCMNIDFATLEDLPGFNNLQSKYLYTSLSVEERKLGFVTTPFTESQLKQAIENKGLIVAKDKGIIVAYIFCGTWEYFSEWPLFPAILNLIVGQAYDGKIISAKNSFQYGPVCIDIPYRGQYLFNQLYEFMRISMSKTFPIGITFINVINEHSYHAHLKKLKLDVIDQLSFNDNEYYILAFSTKKSVR